MIEEITAYIFTYVPWDKEFPIRSCEIVIYARNRKGSRIYCIKF